MQKRLGLDLEVPDEFGHFLAGFSAGEGCFMATIQHRGGYRWLITAYLIGLRADEKFALEYIRERLGVGRVYVRKIRERYPNPMAGYQVYAIADLYHVIVPLFEKYPIPPQFRKAKDFEIWKQIVDIHYHEGGHKPLGFAPGRKSLGSAFLPQSYWNKIEPLVEQLKEVRKFAP